MNGEATGAFWRARPTPGACTNPPLSMTHRLFQKKALGFGCAFLVTAGSWAHAMELEARQVTHGPRHHFFGYIGHVQNIPWNKSGRYILALRTEFQDHMPRSSDAAEIVLLHPDEHVTDAAEASELVGKLRVRGPQDRAVISVVHRRMISRDSWGSHPG